MSFQFSSNSPQKAVIDDDTLEELKAAFPNDRPYLSHLSTKPFHIGDGDHQSARKSHSGLSSKMKATVAHSFQMIPHSGIAVTPDTTGGTVGQLSYDASVDIEENALPIKLYDYAKDENLKYPDSDFFELWPDVDIEFGGTYDPIVEVAVGEECDEQEWPDEPDNPFFTVNIRDAMNALKAIDDAFYDNAVQGFELEVYDSHDIEIGRFVDWDLIDDIRAEIVALENLYLDWFVYGNGTAPARDWRSHLLWTLKSTYDPATDFAWDPSNWDKLYYTVGVYREFTYFEAASQYWETDVTAETKTCNRIDWPGGWTPLTYIDKNIHWFDSFLACDSSDLTFRLEIGGKHSNKLPITYTVYMPFYYYDGAEEDSVLGLVQVNTVITECYFTVSSGVTQVLPREDA